jgi:AraC family transcriptional regulator
MTNFDTIISAIELIEEKIRNSITVSEIADEFGYSCYHFIRLFNGVTGFTPKEYILKRKLCESAKEILCTDKRIIDVAFEYDFQSHESFTRAFRREFGVSPTNIRSRKSLSGMSILEPLSLRGIKACRDTAEYIPEIVSLDAMCVVGISTKISGNYDDIGKIWTVLSGIKDSVANRIIPEKFFQINYCIDSYAEDEFHCMVAVEAHNLDDIPVQLTGKTLPAARYLKFIHKGFSRRVVQTYDYIYRTYLPGTSHNLTVPLNFEYYGDKFKGPMNPESESEIYIPID